MTSEGTSGAITRAAYDEGFPRVSDALTLHLWRRPAFVAVQWSAAAGMPVSAAILLEALLAAFVFALFWTGRFWAGLLLSVIVMLVSVAALMLARLIHAAPATNRVRVAVEVVSPLLWWWGWAHGLAAYGRPLEPIYATMVLWVVVGGTIAVRIVETLALQRFNGMRSTPGGRSTASSGWPARAPIRTSLFSPRRCCSGGPTADSCWSPGGL